MKFEDLEKAAQDFEKETGGKPAQTLLSDFLRWSKEQEKTEKKA